MRSRGWRRGYPRWTGPVCGSVLYAVVLALYAVTLVLFAAVKWLQYLDFAA